MESQTTIYHNANISIIKIFVYLLLMLHPNIIRFLIVYMEIDLGLGIYRTELYGGEQSNRDRKNT